VKAKHKDDAVFLAVTLVGILLVVLVVGYDIYRHPADPRFVHSATVVVSGTGHFQGDVGTAFNLYTLEGSAPLSVEVPYRRADDVSADIRLDEKATGAVEIRVGCRTVAEGAGHVLMWKVPRAWKDGLPPKSWSKCPPKRPWE
jgi:hypothetical protein